MVEVKLYVEGGGESKKLRIECRKGFFEFLRKAGLAGSMPPIVACGSRNNAYESFRTASRMGQIALLLVDSETGIDKAFQMGDPSQWKPWRHLGNPKNDRWKKPRNAQERDCHLMVQVMETWFLADPEALRSFFKMGSFNEKLHPEGTELETWPKDKVYKAVEKATGGRQSGYDKGKHSFKLLEMINCNKVTAASPWAKRFVEETKKKMGIS